MRSPARSTWWWRRRSDPPPLMRFIFAKHVKSLGGPGKIGRLCVGAIPRPGAGDFCRQTKVTKNWLRTCGSKNSLFSDETREHLTSVLEWAVFAEVRHCRRNEPAPSAPLGAPAVPGRSACFYRNAVELLPSITRRRMPPVGREKNGQSDGLRRYPPSAPSENWRSLQRQKREVLKP